MPTIKTGTETRKTIKAVGRVLSGSNAQSIQRGLSSIYQGAESIGKVLVAAGVIEEEYVDRAMSVEAKSFKDFLSQDFEASLTEVIWSRKLAVALDMLQWSFQDACCNPGRTTQSIDDILRDIEIVLQDLATSCPGLRQGEMIRAGERSIEKQDRYSLVEAGSLLNNIRYRFWHEQLSEGIALFKHKFCGIFSCPEGILEGDRLAMALSLIQEFKAFLQGLRKDAPEIHHPVAAVATGIGTEDPDESEQDGVTEEEEEEEEEEEANPDEVDTKILRASSFEIKTGFDVAEAIDSSEVDEFDTEIEGSKNLYPISGILFRIDEPSECSPQVGPGLPLYVPREVAERALANVAHKPLEASSDLTQHDRKGTCGVMTRAEIDGNDFVVHGYLWDHNHSEKVSDILAARGKLGMSMNAQARGHIRQVNGQKVFWITDLELTGGCILLSELATYKKTRVAASAQETPEEWQEIAAQSETQNEGNMLEQDAIQSSLRGLTQGLDALTQEIQAEQSNMRQMLEGINRRLEVIEAERQSELQAQSKRNAAEERAQERQSLIEAIGAAVGERLRELEESIPAMIAQQVRSQINPRGVPARPEATIPLVAGAGVSSQPSERERLVAAIAFKEGELNQTRESGNDFAKELRLMDEIKALKSQAGVPS